MTVEQIAEICHEANRLYCQSLGDWSQPSWGAAPAWQRLSATNGVDYALLHAGVTPEQMHDEWSRQKKRDGWVYGVEKDPVAKTHPCLVPFGELPLEQRRKDYLFRSIVGALSVVPV